MIKRRWQAVYMLALVLGVLVGATWHSQPLHASSPPGQSVHLPVLRYIGNTNEGVEALVQVQNLGANSVRVVMALWAEASGFCGAQAPGPVKFECSGLIQPGSIWTWTSAQIPAWAKSAAVYPVSTCASSLEAVYQAIEPHPLAVSVLRRTVVGSTGQAGQQGASAFDIEVASSYTGIPDWMLGVPDTSFGQYSYYVPLVYADPARFNTWLYIQNAGRECTSVELWFKAQNDCLRAQICDVQSLAPGETFQFDASRCVGPGFKGSAWIRSAQPLAIAVDQTGNDILTTYLGRPQLALAPGTAAQLTPQTFAEGTPGSSPGLPDGREAFPIGSQVAYGPLVFREQQGWDTAIQVQNLSSIVNAKVKMYFLDQSGAPITTLVDWICPRGVQTFFLPVVNNLPGGYVGQVRAESLNWFSGADTQAPNIVAVAELIRFEGPARSKPLEAIAYNLIPEWQAFDWADGATAAFDTGVVALPSIARRSIGTTAELAVQNVVPLPGSTTFAIYLYDQNGLIDYACQRLSARQLAYINFDTWEFINPGFRGSAVVSATRWDHRTPEGRQAVGLAAVAVERSGTRLGIDVPGDESAGTEGIAMPRWWTETWAFRFLGPDAPTCP